VIIDVHTHIVPEDFPPVGNRVAGDRWPSMDHTEPGKANVMISGRNFRTVLSRCWDTSRRIADMPDEGVDRQVLSPMPELLAYQLEPQDGRDLGRHLSETIARMVDSAPDRFYGLGAVPMQDAELARKELSHIKGIGLQGVEVMTNINGKNLGDPEYRPFLKEAESLGLSIFVHAQRPTFKDRLIGEPMLGNAMGFPIENGLAAASLIVGGAMEECPNLRVCFGHGGGVLSQMLPRMDATWRRRDSVKGSMSKSPTDYARMLFYDDIQFSIPSLNLLLQTVGASQVMIGSDYPFMSRSMMPPLPEEFDALGLTAEEREAISSGNCLRFLGLA
jgi:aminocarboxymuconate-semialdehyde decarboxylase